jgi:quercetin dioxygenase-like cupin family protein
MAMLPTSNSSLIHSAQGWLWKTVAEGVRRQVLVHDARTMMARVAFEQGSIGTRHRHLHVQMTYVETGVFAVAIGDEKKVLHAGDAFHVPSDVWHGVECIEAGTLLDVFSPARADFL